MSGPVLKLLLGNLESSHAPHQPMSQVGMTYSSWENHAATTPPPVCQFNPNLNQSSPSHRHLGHLGGGGGMVEQLDTSRGSDASGGGGDTAASAVTAAAAEASGPVGPHDTPPVCGG